MITSERLTNYSSYLLHDSINSAAGNHQNPMKYINVFHIFISALAIAGFTMALVAILQPTGKNYNTFNELHVVPAIFCFKFFIYAMQCLTKK